MGTTVLERIYPFRAIFDIVKRKTKNTADAETYSAVGVSVFARV